MNVITEIESQTCIECFIPFGVPQGFTNMRRKDHRGFYCPNGHSMSYRQDNEEEKAKKLLVLERERAEKNFALAQSREKEIARIKQRVKNGVCPDCNRSFTNLRRHMDSKHKVAP